MRVQVAEEERALKAVKKLWRRNSNTLGFFPEGAFAEALLKRTVLVAMEGGTSFLGYLLFREARGQASITHLCVSEHHRGKGVARALMSHLISLTKGLRGIGLKCRRDFAASDLWPRLGFVAEREEAGRGHDRKTLVYWWRANRDENFFSQAASQLRETQICAVMDANVLFDLLDDPSPKTVPAHSLRADWLDGELELCVTDEIFNEIARSEDAATRDRSRTFAQSFPCLPCQSGVFDRYHSCVLDAYKKERAKDHLNRQEESDVRQIARAIAAEAPFFVTRDRVLLALAEMIEDRWNLVALHPTDLIVRLDEVKRASEYRPARFVGTSLSLRRPKANELARIVSEFCNVRQGEGESAFRRRMQEYLAQPAVYPCLTLFDAKDSPLALVVSCRSSDCDNENE